MFLDATNKSITVAMEAAKTTTESSITAHYVDYTDTDTTPAEADAATNGTTAVEAVAAPASGAQRHVKLLTIFNEDTVAHVFTVFLKNNTTNRRLVSLRLAAGQTLQFTSSKGWEVIAQSAPGSQAVSQTITAENEFTDAILVYAGESVSVSVAGTFVATVSLQRQLDGATWNDVPLPNGDPGWIAPTEMTYIADQTGFVRLGVKTGNFTTGSITARLGTN